MEQVGLHKLKKMKIKAILNSDDYDKYDNGSYCYIIGFSNYGAVCVFEKGKISEILCQDLIVLDKSYIPKRRIRK